VTVDAAVGQDSKHASDRILVHFSKKHPDYWQASLEARRAFFRVHAGSRNSLFVFFTSRRLCLSGHREARELFRLPRIRKFIDHILSFLDFNGMSGTGRVFMILQAWFPTPLAHAARRYRQRRRKQRS
jgi:hypothetical protein